MKRVPESTEVIQHAAGRDQYEAERDERHYTRVVRLLALVIRAVHQVSRDHGAREEKDRHREDSDCLVEFSACDVHAKQGRKSRHMRDEPVTRKVAARIYASGKEAQQEPIEKRERSQLLLSLLGHTSIVRLETAILKGIFIYSSDETLLRARTFDFGDRLL